MLHLTGLPSQGHADEASSLLEEVKLLEAGDVRSGAYSGGMKRRLSVAIALLGDPKASQDLCHHSGRFPPDSCRAVVDARGCVMRTQSTGVFTTGLWRRFPCRSMLAGAGC